MIGDVEASLETIANEYQLTRRVVDHSSSFIAAFHFSVAARRCTVCDGGTGDDPRYIIYIYIYIYIYNVLFCDIFWYQTTYRACCFISTSRREVP